MSSLKPLKSVAHNVCSQFGSTLTYWQSDYGINHLARATHAVGGTVTIDLLNRTSEPKLSGEGPYAVETLSSSLPEILTKEGFSSDLLNHALATYSFTGPMPVPGGCVRYKCRVELETKEGRSYAVNLSDKNG